MKILHINSYLSGSSFYKNLYNKQRDSDLDIDVYVPVARSTDDSSLKLEDYITLSKNHSKYDRLFFYAKHKKILEDVKEKYAIDEYSIIHAHSLFSNGYIAYKLKKDFGIPYIVAVRNTDINLFFKKMILLRKLGVQILKEAKSVIFLSKPYRNFVIKKYIPNKLKKEILDRSEVIPNGIDDFWFQNLGEPKPPFEKENLKLLYVGVLDKNKNLATTVKAIKILQERGFNIKFTIVGRIKDKSVYRSIKDLPYVNYVIPKPKETLISIYRSNDIFVMPSVTETFGLVYAEAMSQGLPVIYSKGQGFDGQFNEGVVGYSVESSSAVEISNKVEDILANYVDISKNCVNKVDKFNWRKISEEYIQLY